MESKAIIAENLTKFYGKARGIDGLNLDPDQFVPGLDIPMMYREMYWAAEGYLWEMLQQGDLDIDRVEKDFKKLIVFWKSIYQRKE